MSAEGVAACITDLRQAGSNALPNVASVLRQAYFKLASTDFMEADVFARPYMVFAGHESGIANSMADLRLELEGTLISMAEGVDLIGAALIQTADEYEQTDFHAQALIRGAAQQ